VGEGAAMSAYYNENDPFAAAWLRELIKAGLIADGEVDERDIRDVTADDVRGFVQCHFFAGIGGWSYALRLAGWPDTRRVWTGNCPCQPWSSAGTGLEADDPRDLWPTWFELWQECRPDVGIGEQVAGKPGGAWLDRLHADLEAIHYAVGAVDLPAASVGAFTLRQRLWWVADSNGDRWGPRPTAVRRQAGSDVAGVRVRVGDAERERRQSRHQDRSGTSQLGPACRLDRPWDHYVLVTCGDGKVRPLEPGLEPLAHGIPARVGRLRGYGNAINPYVAAAFIEAYLAVSDPVV
jgi:DNA (cytosine-5)-methyltransferase 1